VKRKLLPALVLGGVLGLLAFGVWWWRVREERFSAQRAGEIKNEKLKIENEDREKELQWLGSYATPGPVKTQVEGREQTLAINGAFVTFEDIPDSPDKYLVLDASRGPLEQKDNDLDGFTFKVRLVFTPNPDKGIRNTTELSIIRPLRDAPSVQDALKVVGNLDKLDKETLGFFFRPGIWLTAILYRKDKTSLVRDELGYYYARAVTVREL